jgi:hypothetical protein
MLSCRIIPLFFAVLALHVLLAPPAPAVVIPLEGSQDLAAAVLAIGDDLAVSWPGAPPDTLLLLRVVDDGGTVVVEKVALSGEDGLEEPAALWLRSGVVGCDPWSETEADRYRFRTLGEAEAVLLDRAFGIEIMEADSGALLLSKALAFAPNIQPCLYFSDATGCPRQRFERTEVIYLSGRHLNPGTSLVFFMVPGGEPPAVGDPVEEVRADYEGGAQGFSAWVPNLGGVNFTLAVGGDAMNPPVGCYRGLAREGTTWEPVRQAEDFWVDFDHCLPFRDKAVSVNTVVRTSDKPDDGPDCPEAGP